MFGRLPDRAFRVYLAQPYHKPEGHRVTGTRYTCAPFTRMYEKRVGRRKDTPIKLMVCLTRGCDELQLFNVHACDVELCTHHRHQLLLKSKGKSESILRPLSAIVVIACCVRVQTSKRDLVVVSPR